MFLENSWFVIFVAVLLGLGIGSFINVAVDRFHAGQSLLGRSRCPHCTTILPWYTLIPVFSYVALRGRCHFCGKTIAIQYPLVELATAILFVLIAIRFWTAPAEMLWHIAMGAILIMIFLSDLKYYEIPDAFSLPGLVIAVGGQLIFDTDIWKVIVGILIGGGIFLIQYVVSKGKWVGGGDIRLGALLGAYLAWPGTLVGLFLAYLLGGTVAVVLLLCRVKRIGDRLPFGTALTIATIVAVFFGDRILQWYVYELFSYRWL